VNFPPRILEVNQVCQFACANNVEISVTIDIRDGHILGGGSILAARESHKNPPVPVAGTECDADIAVKRAIVLSIRFVNGNDIEIAVFVEIRHLESISAANGNATRGFIVDDVFPPGNELPIHSAGFGRCRGHGPGRGVTLDGQCDSRGKGQTGNEDSKSSHVPP
jgi:hypothetical protein